MDDSCGLVDETQFIFEREIELEDSLSDSETSIESIDGQGSNDVNIDDDLDPVTFCSPRYFAFNEGTYKLMVNDLLGNIKVTIESLKETSKGAPLTILAWKRMKTQLMLKNEHELYLKLSPHLRI